ncbi:MAG: efflux RND transporter periplasmic adaptor subunit [Lysobacterales bacterium]
MIPEPSVQDRAIAPPAVHRKHLLTLVGAGTLGLLALWAIARWAGAEASIDADRVRVASVTRGTLVRDVVVNGRTVAAVSPTLYAPAAGTISLKIVAGDAVKRGQELARIDSPALTNELQREQAMQEQLEAEVARQRILAQKAGLLARRDADESALAEHAAARELQRVQRGFELGALPEIDLLKAKDSLRAAEIRAAHAGKAAELEGEDVGLALKTNQQQLERQRLVVANLKRQVEELSIRAPVDGVIGTLSVAERAVLAANAPLLTVVDLSRLEVELEVPESYAKELGIGLAAEVSIGTATVRGQLTAMSPEVVDHQVLARVRFDGGQPAGLRQNQRISARILIDEKPDVLMLPRGPFVENEGGRFAYVMEDGVAVRRPIELGATSVSAVEIRSGLRLGDRVVIAGTDSFENAQRIAINP